MIFGKINKIIIKIFGSRNERLVKSYSVIARQAGEFEEKTKQLDGEALKAKILVGMHESHQMLGRFHYTVLNRVLGIYTNMGNGGTT